MKEFSIHELDTSQQRERPEDILETNKNLEVTKRERAFEAEGGFKDMLRLKITIHDLTQDGDGILNGNGQSMFDEIIKDPRTYRSWLGIDVLQENVPDETIQKHLEEFLEKAKISCTKSIDHTLGSIRNYKARFDSNEFTNLDSMLETLKKLLSEEKWAEYDIRFAESKGYLRGMQKILELACGVGVEGDNARKVLGLKEE